MSRKKTIEEVERAFNERNYILLSKEYIDAHHKLEYICPEGHKGSISWRSFSQGRGCRECGRISIVKKKTLDYEYVQQVLNNKGYILLSKEYHNAHEQLDCICPKGHKCKIRFNDFNHGHGCKECGNELRSQVQRTEYETIKMGFEKEGHFLITETYINNKQELLVRCPNGHTYTTNWNRFQSGLRCPICNSSKGEETIIKLLKDLQVKFIHDKSIWKPLNNLRPDFFLPDYNLVIEFDGIQHFEPIEIFGGQEGFIKRQQKDNEKNIYCENNNIDILRIPYWEFNNITKIIKNKLKIN